MTTTPRYYAPAGGLPPQTQLTTDRAVFTEAYAVLPRGTILRLEQKPAGSGIKVKDTPGWGMVGTSLEPSIFAVLSNVVTGNKYGTVTYRVTLRDAEGTIVARSKPFKVVWHP